MSTHRHEAPTVAREISGLSPASAPRACNEDALTSVFVRGPRPRPRALLQTMTVRAVAALTAPVRGRRRPRRSARRRRVARWWPWVALVLGAGALGSSVALLGSTAVAPHTAPATVRAPAPPRLKRLTNIATGSGSGSASNVPLPAPRPSPSAPTTPARAADQLTAGDYGAALASYRQLASKHPDQTAYAQVARILARDLARRCHAARGAEEAACTP